MRPGTRHQLHSSGLNNLNQVWLTCATLHSPVQHSHVKIARSAVSLTKGLVVSQGLFDAAYFRADYINLHEHRDEVLKTVLLLKPGQPASIAFAQLTPSSYPAHVYVGYP